MKPPGSDAWRGLTASLFLHLTAAAAVLGVAAAGRVWTPPVIELSLLPPGGTATSTPARAERVRPPSGSFPMPVRKAESVSFAVPDANPSPAPPSLPPSAAEKSGPETAPAESSPPSGSTENGPGALASSFPPVPSDAPSISGPPPGNAETGRPAGYGYLREAIQRGIVYPLRARRMGWEGRVEVEFLILPDGTVRNVRVARGSGYAVLDRNAVEAVRSAAPFPRPPSEATVRTPVVYKLE